jgi:hypothetical protein
MVAACLGTTAGMLVLIPDAQAAGKVIPAKVAELVDVSEQIVLAKVDSLEVDPDPKHPDHKIRRAKATVKEVWKGPKVETVEYRISKSGFPDSSYAKSGETVLLFLKKEEGGWGIAWAGTGRMELKTQDSKEYLAYERVVLPAGTPSVDLSGGKNERDNRGVELKLLKEMVVGKK